VSRGRGAVTPPVAAWYLYLARCADGSLYCGIARDVSARLAAHDAGRGARYTRGRGPLELLLTRRCKDKSQALRLELYVKALPREEKLAAAERPRRLDALARAALLSKNPDKTAVSSQPRGSARRRA
jgi:putative endonuclease